MTLAWPYSRPLIKKELNIDSSPHSYFTTQMSEDIIKVSIPSTVFCLPHRFTVNVSVTVAPILTPSNLSPTPTGCSTPVTMLPIVFAGMDTTAELCSAGCNVTYSPTSTLISNDVASGHESPFIPSNGPTGTSPVGLHL
jgi:hypothetical protein